MNSLFRLNWKPPNKCLLIYQMFILKRSSLFSRSEILVSKKLRRLKKVNIKYWSIRTQFSQSMGRHNT